MVDWTNLYKIKIRNHNDSFAKHEHIKLSIVRNLLLKYKNKLKYHEIYTEWAMNRKISDVFHLNNLTKEQIAYEIQSKITKKWLEETRKKYDELGVDWVLIDLNKISDNIKEIDKQIKELIL